MFLTYWLLQQAKQKIVMTNEQKNRCCWTISQPQTDLTISFANNFNILFCTSGEQKFLYRCSQVRNSLFRIEYVMLQQLREISLIILVPSKWQALPAKYWPLSNRPTARRLFLAFACCCWLCATNCVATGVLAVCRALTAAIYERGRLHDLLMLLSLFSSYGSQWLRMYRRRFFKQHELHESTAISCSRSKEFHLPWLQYSPDTIPYTFTSPFSTGNWNNRIFCVVSN